MLIYLGMFCVSCALLKCVENKAKNNRQYIFIVFLALLLPCIVAGLRADVVGTDVRGYIVPLSEYAASATNIFEYFNMAWKASWKMMEVKDYEPLFNVLVLICVRLMASKQLLLFVIQALTVFPLYKGLERMVEKKYRWIGMLVYYFMFYNASLNMMRQWIAMALLIYSFSYLVNEEYMKYLAFAVLAFLFHRSAIVALVFCVLRKIDARSQFRRGASLSGWTIRSQEIDIVIWAAIAVFVFNASFLVAKVLAMIGLGKYSSYFGFESTFLITQLVLRLPIWGLFVLNRQRIKDYVSHVLLLFLVFECIFANYVSGAEHLFRIATWFSSYSVITYPILIERTKKRYRLVITSLVVLWLFLYWYYMIVFKGSHETVPYLFYWQQ